MTKRLLLFATLLGLSAGAAHAAYPERPITLIVPFAAGGPTDVVARIVGDHMSRTLGQQVVVENVTGAGGTTGTTRAAQAAPAPILIVARKNFPPKDLKEFISYAKANSEKLNEAHAGVGSVSFTTCSLLNSILGIKPTRVPYQGTGPALNDLVGGQVDYMCDQIVNLTPQIQAGSIKAYGIATEKRSPALPDVPTTKEGGLPEFQVSAWNALFAPKGTPKEVVTKLNGALVKALDDETTRKRLLDLGAEIADRAGRTPEALEKLVTSEIARWNKVLRAQTAAAK